MSQNARKVIALTITMILMSLAAAACSSPDTTPTPTRAPSPVFQATFTATATNTATVTPTLVPTKTPSPSQKLMYSMNVNSDVWYTVRNGSNQQVKVVFNVTSERVEWQAFTNMPLAQGEYDWALHSSGGCSKGPACPNGFHVAGNTRTNKDVDVLVIWDGVGTPRIVSFTPWVLDGAKPEAILPPEKCLGGQTITVPSYQEFYVIECNAVGKAAQTILVAYNGFGEAKVVHCTWSSACNIPNSHVDNTFTFELNGVVFTMKEITNKIYTFTIPPGHKLGP